MRRPTPRGSIAIDGRRGVLRRLAAGQKDTTRSESELCRFDWTAAGQKDAIRSESELCRAFELSINDDGKLGNIIES